MQKINKELRSIFLTFSNGSSISKMKNNNNLRIFYLFYIFKAIFAFSCQFKNDRHMNSYDLKVNDSLNGHTINISCEKFIHTGNIEINELNCKSYIDERDQSNQNISKIKTRNIINSTLNIQNLNKNATKENNIIYTDSEEIEEKNNDHHIPFEIEGKQSIHADPFYVDSGAEARNFNSRAIETNNTYINHMNVSGSNCEDCRDCCKNACEWTLYCCILSSFIVSCMGLIFIVLTPDLNRTAKGILGTIVGLGILFFGWLFLRFCRYIDE